MSTAIVIFIVWALLGAGIGVLVGFIARSLRGDDAPLPPQRPEWCEVCGEELCSGWVLRQALDRDDSDGSGSGMSAYYCDGHRPAAGVRWPA